MPGRRLSVEERAQIEVLFGQGLRFPQIAAVIGRDRTTVWREVSRNHQYRGNYLDGAGGRHPDGRSPGGGRCRLGGAYRWVYHHQHAQRRAAGRARRPRRGKLVTIPGQGRPSTPQPLWSTVEAKLLQRWSPTQIARWLRHEFPDRPEQWVSHETIYHAIYYQARGGMRSELTRQVALRSGRGETPHPSPRHHRRGRDHRGRGTFPQAVDR